VSSGEASCDASWRVAGLSRRTCERRRGQFVHDDHAREREQATRGLDIFDQV
jgi:hypothetical protein